MPRYIGKVEKLRFRLRARFSSLFPKDENERKIKKHIAKKRLVSLSSLLLKDEKDNEALFYALANGDAQKISFIKKMQLFDFYSLLECRDNEIKAQNKKIEQQNQKLKTNR